MQDSPQSSQERLNSNISFSSVETQRKLRIQKLQKIRELGQEPFAAVAKRDFTLGCVRFWFDFIHKFDLHKALPGDEMYVLDYFLEKVLFPQSLLERMEERLQLRHTVREMGLDPDNEEGSIEDEFEPEMIDEARNLLPDLLKKNISQRITLLNELLKETEDEETSDLMYELSLKPHQVVTLAGRIKSKRVSGKIAFSTVEDESCPEGFQFIFKKDILDDQTSKNPNALGFQHFKELLDEGDYIQVTGHLDYAQSGEPSLFVESYIILTKSLRPLPEKLEDVEQKYRQRYIDMRLHPEVREMFRMKSRFWQATRDFMLDNGFMEVQMPTMEETTGGAEANPFVTHHDALDEDFYLRISSELHQKRMIVAGFEKIFDIEKNYRNEGIDDEHLQEYYQMEFYWAYASNNDLLDYCEKLMKNVIEKTFGSLQLMRDGQMVDWSKPWPRMPYYQFVEHFAGISLKEYDTVEKLKQLADKLNLSYDEHAGYGRMIDLIYKKTARPKCIEPVWLVDHPVEISPLAKRKPENPQLTQRSQLIAYGSELTNGYSELNDPIDQMNRFEEQQALRESGDSEAMMIDKDFVNALEIGMPPTAGFAYSERVFSLLMNKPIRECTAFPLMRKEKPEKSKEEIKSLQIVLLDNPEIPTWSKMNAAAHLTASFSARFGKKILGTNKVETADGISVPLSIPHGIVIRSAENQQNLIDLLKECESKNLEYIFFTKDMRDSKNQNEDIQFIQSKTFADLEILGVLIFGKRNSVLKLTENFPLLS